MLMVAWVPLKMGQKTLNIFNIHNFGLTAGVVHQIGAKIREWNEYDAVHSDCCASFVLGDFNFLPNGEFPLPMVIQKMLAWFEMFITIVRRMQGSGIVIWGTYRVAPASSHKV